MVDRTEELREVAVFQPKLDGIPQQPNGEQESNRLHHRSSREQLEEDENTEVSEVFFHGGNIRPPRSGRGSAKGLIPKFREEVPRIFRWSRREFEHRRHDVDAIYQGISLYPFGTRPAARYPHAGIVLMQCTDMCQNGATDAEVVRKVRGAGTTHQCNRLRGTPG